DVMGEVVGRMQTKLHAEFESKIAKVTRKLEHEVNALRRERDQLRAQIRGLEQTHAQQVEGLRQQVAAQQRDVAQLQEILRTQSFADLRQDFADGLRQVHSDLLDKLR